MTRYKFADAAASDKVLLTLGSQKFWPLNFFMIFFWFSNAGGGLSFELNNSKSFCLPSASIISNCQRGRGIIRSSSTIEYTGQKRTMRSTELCEDVFPEADHGIWSHS